MRQLSTSLSFATGRVWWCYKDTPAHASPLVPWHLASEHDRNMHIHNITVPLLLYLLFSQPAPLFWDSLGFTSSFISHLFHPCFLLFSNLTVVTFQESLNISVDWERKKKSYFKKSLYSFNKNLRREQRRQRELIYVREEHVVSML